MSSNLHGCTGLEKVKQKRCAGLETVKQKRVCVVRAATSPGQGGGVMDRPTLDKPTPGRESEFDLK